MKRILALDGGGVRGVFTLRILARIEQLLREHRCNPDLVLADEFDLFAGTSTGAIIAAGLCWGMTVAQIESLYIDHGGQMFTRVPWHRRWKCKFQSACVADVFRTVFSEKDGLPAKLGSSRLRKLLLVIMRNATTGSAWPVTNNPAAKYNDRALEDCNLEIPLWQLLRGSTAAPSFYSPEVIRLGSQEFVFIDGAITPYNNPALIAALTATLPCYRVGWTASPRDLLLVSVGTGEVRPRIKKRLAEQINLLDFVETVPLGLINTSAMQQDMLCRVLGRCLYGASIDSEVGALDCGSLLNDNEQKFSYVRYDERLDVVPEFSQRLKRIDDLVNIPTLQAIGHAYADAYVDLRHFVLR